MPATKGLSKASDHVVFYIDQGYIDPEGRCYGKVIQSREDPLITSLAVSAPSAKNPMLLDEFAAEIASLFATANIVKHPRRVEVFPWRTLELHQQLHLGMYEARLCQSDIARYPLARLSAF